MPPACGRPRQALRGALCERGRVHACARTHRSGGAVRAAFRAACATRVRDLSDHSYPCRGHGGHRSVSSVTHEAQVPLHNTGKADSGMAVGCEYSQLCSMSACPCPTRRPQLGGSLEPVGLAVVRGGGGAQSPSQGFIPRALSLLDPSVCFLGNPHVQGLLSSICLRTYPRGKPCPLGDG